MVKRKPSIVFLVLVLFFSKAVELISIVNILEPFIEVYGLLQKFVILFDLYLINPILFILSPFFDWLGISLPVAEILVNFLSFALIFNTNIYLSCFVIFRDANVDVKTLALLVGAPAAAYKFTYTLIEEAKYGILYNESLLETAATLRQSDPFNKRDREIGKIIIKTRNRENPPSYWKFLFFYTIFIPIIVLGSPFAIISLLIKAIASPFIYVFVMILIISHELGFLKLDSYKVYVVKYFAKITIISLIYVLLATLLLISLAEQIGWLRFN